MGAIQLPDELQRVIEETRRTAQAGIADMEASRYATVATSQDGQLLHERMMERLRERLAADK